MGYCPEHGVPFEHRKGTAKATGKPYSFWACPKKSKGGGFCDHKPEEWLDSQLKELGFKTRNHAAAWITGADNTKWTDYIKDKAYAAAVSEIAAAVTAANATQDAQDGPPAAYEPASAPTAQPDAQQAAQGRLA